MEKGEVRQHIEVLVLRELLGPGSVDEVLNARPSDIYLTGILWPRGTSMEADEDDSGGTEVASDDSESIDAGVPGYRAVRPCSIGITFETDNFTAIVVTLGATARYRVADPPTRNNSVSLPGQQTGDEFEWHRVPLNYRLTIPADESRTEWRTHNFVGPDGKSLTDLDVAIDVRRRVHGERLVITLTLINSAEEAPNRIRDSSLLFQTEMRVDAELAQGSGRIRPRETYPFADDDDQMVNLLLYRNTKEFAAGHGVAVMWSQPVNERVDEVHTSWLPRAPVFGTDPAGHQSLRDLQARDPSPFSAATLSEESRREVTCGELDALCDTYWRWIQGLGARLSSFSGTLAAAAERNEQSCTHTLERMRRGVHVLRSDDAAWLAFTLANRAMDKQSAFPSKGSQAKPLIWRPFQLAFMLLVIPGLVDATDPLACRDTMDLLWFPTGGGKTEAYLALTAFEIFRRRIVDGSRRSSGGTDVLMRYTMRLLTIQQFQRAAALITACDLIRQADVVKLGAAPISLGLYVGKDSTPNRLSDAVEKLQEEAGGRKPASTPRQLLECPVCRANLPTSAYHIDTERRRMHVCCGSPACPTGGMPLPIITVDEAIYAHPPSLLIATIDKFAQLPRNQSIQSLFGRPGSRLGLIIQDELHLISGPLGSMAGLYEATIDLLCTDGDVRPKIIGSTATIGRASRQVRALFDREVLTFPPPGFEASDSFFAVRDEFGPDRLYLGIASAGRSPKFALQAVLAAVMQSVHVLRAKSMARDSDLDPYWTCVAYFNSLRELGGAHVLMLDDVRRQVAFLAGRSGVTERRLEEPPLELSSRVPSREIPEVLLSLGRSIGSADPYDPDPPDSVLASNMISVGVDVPRLGLMVVAGQPKSTAEYIQATSRVGRGLPGLVVTLYNFGRPRDLSHFEHYLSYHGALYVSVEATSVTPWAPRARDKALHAVFAGAVRHLVAGLRADDAAIDFVAADAEVQRIISYLVSRAKGATSAAGDANIRAELDGIAAEWERKASNARAANRKFNYWEKPAPFGKTSPHLLCSAEEMTTSGSNAWAAPNSLREVEPSTAFVLKRRR